MPGINRRPIGFEPDPDIPDALGQGIGQFRFDDGSSEFGMDPELAQMASEAQMASQAPPGMGAELPPVPDMQLQPPSVGDAVPDPLEGLTVDDVSIDDPPDPVALGGAGGGGPAAPQAPHMPSSAAGAFRQAAASEAAGRFEAPRDPGFRPQQRSGALPEDVAQRHQQESSAEDADLETQTELAREREAKRLRDHALEETARLKAQKAEADEQRREAEQRKQRLLDEQRRIAEMELDREFAGGDIFAKLALVLTAGVQGYVGSDSALRMAERSIDRQIRTQINQRDSKLSQLAVELGSEEQAIEEAKAKGLEFAARQVEAAAQLSKAQGIEDESGLVLAGLRQKHGQARRRAEELSLGKTLEVYDPGSAGGYVPGDPEKVAELMAKSESAARDEGEFALKARKMAGGDSSASNPKLWAGLPEQEQYVGQELAAYAKRNGMSMKQARDAWSKFSAKFEAGAPAEQAVIDALAVIEPYRHSGDVPGMGVFGSMPPEWWASGEGVKVRQQLGVAQAFFQKEISGAAVSDQEREILKKVVQGSGNFDEIEQGLRAIQKARGAKYLEIENAASSFARIRKKSMELGRKHRLAKSPKYTEEEIVGKRKSDPDGAPNPAAPRPGMSDDEISAMTAIMDPNPLR